MGNHKYSIESGKYGNTQWVNLTTLLFKEYTDDEISYAISKLSDDYIFYILNFNNPFLSNHEFEAINNIIKVFKKTKPNKTLSVLDSDLNPNSIKYDIIENYKGNFFVFYDDNNTKLKKHKDLQKTFICLIGRESHERDPFNKFFLDNKLDKISFYNYGDPTGDIKRGELNRRSVTAVSDEFNYGFCNIIHDTFFDYNKYNVNHFNEKIVKPMLAKIPFVIYGVPYQLKLLKELGFKTFDKWWDESYDTEIDTSNRVNKLNDLILNISKFESAKINKIYDEMKPILSYNKKLMRYYLNKYKMFDMNNIIEF